MDIKQSLILNNVWWQDKKINPEFLLNKKRDEFNTIIQKLDEKRILSIIGPRRVGKSTLIYQAIDYLLNTLKIDKKRILFFSGDDPTLFFNENDKLSNVLEVYFDEILKESFTNLKSKVYIFIDEIHFIKNWQNYLKIYFDRKYNVKFIITGSSSLHLFKDANESLLGRIENIYVLPLTFQQFLNFHRAYVAKKDDIIIPKFDLDNPEESFTKLEQLYENKNLQLTINEILNEYVLVGGYPEYFENRDIDVWQKLLLDDIITRGIYKDILTMYNIRSPEVLEKLLYYIAANNSQTFSYAGMTSNFNIDTITLISYVGYLKQAFLINVLENYSTNVGKVIRANKKLSILDNGIQNSLLKKKTLSDDDIGHIIESMLAFDIRLLSEKENYNEYYYRNTKKEEIDIIVDRKIDIIPIEVKYKNKIETEDTKTIKNFCDSYKDKILGKVNYGIIITKNILKKQDNIYFIPYSLFNL